MDNWIDWLKSELKPSNVPSIQLSIYPNIHLSIRPIFVFLTVLLFPIGLALAAETVDPRTGLTPTQQDAILKYVDSKTARNAGEPKAETVSLDNAARFLDSVAIAWQKKRNCVTCHTIVPYGMVRHRLQLKSPAVKAVDGLLDRTADALNKKVASGGKPHAQDILPLVATLVLRDMANPDNQGKLPDRTGKLLEAQWSFQRDDGSWNWKFTYYKRPFQSQEYHGVALAALAASMAPAEAVQSKEALAGIEKLRTYFAKKQAPSKFHKLFLLWASLHNIEFMDAKARDAFYQELVPLQNADGGWATEKLGPWEWAPLKDPPGDGLSTGLVTYLALKMGKKDQPEIVKALQWLKTNQHKSGKWFTPSLGSTTRTRYITNAGTAYAVLALTEAEK